MEQDQPAQATPMQPVDSVNPRWPQKPYSDAPEQVNEKGQRVDSQGRLLCHAHRTGDGAACRAPALRGMKVCRMHGGATKQARMAAKLRLAELVDPAIGTLARVMVNAAKDSDRMRAADSILDRTGYGRVQKVERTDAKDMLVQRLMEMRGAGDVDGDNVDELQEAREMRGQDLPGQQ